jgi:hypothetical protein
MQRLSSGVDILRTHRHADGRWRRFPFYYTLLALLEFDDKKATHEMEYAAPRLESILRHPDTGDHYASRRRAVAEQVLARI